MNISQVSVEFKSPPFIQQVKSVKRSQTEHWKFLTRFSHFTSFRLLLSIVQYFGKWWCCGASIEWKLFDTPWQQRDEEEDVSRPHSVVLVSAKLGEQDKTRVLHNSAMKMMSKHDGNGKVSLCLPWRAQKNYCTIHSSLRLVLCSVHACIERKKVFQLLNSNFPIPFETHLKAFLNFHRMNFPVLCVRARAQDSATWIMWKSKLHICACKSREEHQILTWYMWIIWNH